MRHALTAAIATILLVAGCSQTSAPPASKSGKKDAATVTVTPSECESQMRNGDVAGALRAAAVKGSGLDAETAGLALYGVGITLSDPVSKGEGCVVTAEISSRSGSIEDVRKTQVVWSGRASDQSLKILQGSTAVDALAGVIESHAASQKSEKAADEAAKVAAEKAEKVANEAKDAMAEKPAPAETFPFQAKVLDKSPLTDKPRGSKIVVGGLEDNVVEVVSCEDGEAAWCKVNWRTFTGYAPRALLKKVDLGGKLP